MPDVVELNALAKNLGAQDSFQRFRLHVGWTIIGLFILTDIFVMVLTGWLACQDYQQILVNPQYQRVIDAKVVLALIGATVVELGAFTLGLGKHLFPPG